jgi:type II secretory pathway component PulK
MKPSPCQRWEGGAPGRKRGSILIYVLWILILITGLAFHVSSASRVTTLNQSAASRQLKNQMQIDSAIQFAVYQILAERWQNFKFELYLNQQKLVLEIFNESGFISLYQTSNRDLRNVFREIALPQQSVDELAAEINAEDKSLRFNSFDEIRRIDGIDSEMLARLSSLVTIYHEESVNPQLAPENVLMHMKGIDKYRVQQLLETEDAETRLRLRQELTQIVTRDEGEYSDNMIEYFRIRLALDDQHYRVVLKVDNRKSSWQVLQVESIMLPARPAS